jgi:hypothetical protein
MKIDSTRAKVPDTGILCRAYDSEGNPGSYDIAHLDRESLFEWLRSRGGDNIWAENTVAILLGHEVDERPD